jgi:hypothetical protein
VVNCAGSIALIRPLVNMAGRVVKRHVMHSSTSKAVPNDLARRFVPSGRIDPVARRRTHQGFLQACSLILTVPGDEKGGRRAKVMESLCLKRVFRQATAWLLVVTILTMGFWPPDTLAMLAPALPPGTLSPSDPSRVADLQKIQSVLESKVIRQRLEDFGLSQEEISTRLDKLSDDQLHQFATEIDAMIPAGDGLGIVIALLVIAILVVILVYLLDHRIVITKNGD